MRICNTLVHAIKEQTWDLYPPADWDTYSINEILFIQIEILFLVSRPQCPPWGGKYGLYWDSRGGFLYNSWKSCQQTLRSTRCQHSPHMDNLSSNAAVSKASLFPSSSKPINLGNTSAQTCEIRIYHGYTYPLSHHPWNISRMVEPWSWVSPLARVRSQRKRGWTVSESIWGPISVLRDQWE